MNDEQWIARETRTRAALTRRQTLVGGTFLAAGIAGVALKPRRAENLLGKAKMDDMVPRQIGAYTYNTTSGLVLPPPDQLRDKLYSQLLTRTYVRDGFPPVMLLIAYSGAQDGTLQIHRPEVCYPASGFRLTRIAEHVIPLTGGASVPGRAITAESEVRREQLIYWTRLGSHFPTDWAKQHMAVAAENFAGVIPDGVLVRMSTVGTGERTAELDGFAATLVRSVGHRMRQVLLGPGAV